MINRSKRSNRLRSRKSSRTSHTRSRKSSRTSYTRSRKSSPNRKSSPSKKYTIKRNQQYELGGEQFFKVTDGNTTYRDLYVDLSKNGKTGLMQLASVLQIKNKHIMKKDQLLQAVRKLIQFE